MLLRLDSYLGVLMCIRCSVGFMRAAPSGHWRGRLCADGQKMCWCAAALGSMPSVVPRRDRELCFSMGVDDSNSQFLFLGLPQPSGAQALALREGPPAAPV